MIPGRPFLRHLTELSKVPKHLDFIVRLSCSAHSDILWWHTFISAWNGKGFLPFAQAQMTLASDASGSWGCGALWGTRWIQLNWSDHLHLLNISCMEILPILLAAGVWDIEWYKKQLVCICDNEAVVATLNKRSAKDPGLAQGLRCLSFYVAHYHFSMHTRHIPGHCNQAADAQLIIIWDFTSPSFHRPIEYQTLSHHS